MTPPALSARVEHDAKYQNQKRHKELKALYYSNPKVTAMMDQQNEETFQVIIDYFSLLKNRIKINDLEAAAIITFDIISSIVDRITLGDESIHQARILEAGVEAVFKYLML